MFSYYFEADISDAKQRVYCRVECAATIRFEEDGSNGWFVDDWAVITQDGDEIVIDRYEIDPFLQVCWRAIKAEWHRNKAYHTDKIEELAADYEPARPMVEFSEAV